MAEKVEKKETTEQVTATPATEKKPAAKTEKKEVKPVEKKKDGIFKRAKNWCKENKKALIAGGIGVAAGAAGTIGVSEIGKRSAERRARNTATRGEDVSPLDPNV